MLADIRIAVNGDVWIRVQNPYTGQWYEMNQTRIDAYLNAPITIKITDIES